MSYIENPKTKDSGILCCIPQTGTCPMKCSDCFFQSGRSFLEPLDENLPNMPKEEQALGLVVRVNDGNDSNNQRDLVIDKTEIYSDKFYNTSIPKDLEGFDAPVVLTINPAKMTDIRYHALPDPIPQNLMFVRIRTDMWNLNLVSEAVDYYTERDVPVVLTFMAYFNDPVPVDYRKFYEFKKRTLNSYYVIKYEAWKKAMAMFETNPLVHSCSGPNNFKCKNCGTCIREYYVTKTRMLR